MFRIIKLSSKAEPTPPRPKMLLAYIGATASTTAVFFLSRRSSPLPNLSRPIELEDERRMSDLPFTH